MDLLETAVRNRIESSYYWREQCLGLNAATLLDRAVELTFIGETYGTTQRPTPFLCLAYKLLELQPERDIILFYLQEGGEEFKYLCALAAFHIRLTWKDDDIYSALDPLKSDYRKLRRRIQSKEELTIVDQFIDDLLTTTTRICSTTLP